MHVSRTSGNRRCRPVRYTRNNRNRLLVLFFPLISTLTYIYALRRMSMRSKWRDLKRRYKIEYIVRVFSAISPSKIKTEVRTNAS